MLIDEYKSELSMAPVDSDDKEIKTKKYWQDQIDWLEERFPEGVYRDVIGLCKAATLEEEDGIIEQDYSLNAGRYVGVAIEDDGMTKDEYKDTMVGLADDLQVLDKSARELETKIRASLLAMFEE